jgi:GTP-binding protein
MKKPVIAIVGRPNVGKSALFNRLCKKRIAIIAEEEGVTRDSLYQDVTMGKYSFTLVDTGGIGNSSIAFYQQVAQKTQKALNDADGFIFVVDAFSGVTLLDQEVAKILLKSKKPIILAVNKVDGEFHEDKTYDFYSLGIETLIGVSAAHGYQIEALRKQIKDIFLSSSFQEDEENQAYESKSTTSYATKKESGKKSETDVIGDTGNTEDLNGGEEEGDVNDREASSDIEENENQEEDFSEESDLSVDGDSEDEAIEDETDESMEGDEEQNSFGEPEERKLKIAIIGKPNVGKSTLFNALLQEEKSIVSSQAGTTRDNVEAVLENYLFIDTAGLKKQCREKELVGKISALRTYEAIDRSDICIFVVDAQQKVSAQEKQIAKYIANQRRCCIVLFNKWDLVKNKRMEHLLKEFHDEVPFLEYCPVLCISAQARRNIDKIWPMISIVSEARGKKISTPELNKFVEECLQKYHPPMIKGKRFRIYYLTQLHSFPPRFLLFVNNPKLLDKSYERYLLHQLRLAFGFDGVPLFFTLKAKK